MAALLRDQGAVLPKVISRHRLALMVAGATILILTGLILYIVSSQGKVTRGQNKIIAKQNQVISVEGKRADAETKRADDATKVLNDTKTQDAAERAILLQQTTDLKTQIGDLKKTQSIDLSQRAIIDNLRTQQINSIAIQLANLPANASSDQIAVLQDQVARLQKTSPAVTYSPIDPPPTVHCQRLLLLPGCN